VKGIHSPSIAFGPLEHHLASDETDLCGCYMDENTIRLEQAYISRHDEKKLTLQCESVTYYDPEYHRTNGADGSVMLSVIKPAQLYVTGLPADFDFREDWQYVYSPFVDDSGAAVIRVEPRGRGAAAILIR
jgi:hypothetical protein